MTDAEDYEDLQSEPGAIGVGMGGSCPVCRAPVDLGQEFCLECGSPIRFTPRQRRQQRGRPAEGARAAAPASMPPKSGFPWIPFLVVLALIGGGVAFALVDGGDPKKSNSSSVEDPLPSIDSTTPETTSDTETTTVEDCSSVGSPLDETQPAVGGIDPTTGQPGDPSLTDGGETIPQVDDGTVQDGSSDAFQDPSVPSTTGDTSEETVTVDRNGNLCAGDAVTEDPTTTDPLATTPTSTTPATTTPTSTTPTTTTPTTTTSGTWPQGKEGWTVIVDGYNTAERASQRAADVQADGFADSGTLFSSDFDSLCPGIHVVYSGVFDKKSEAEARVRELSNKDYAGMEIREIKQGGGTPARCSNSSRPQN